MTDYSNVTEQQVRDFVMNADPLDDEFHLVAFGKFSPGGDGYYPAIDVICQRDPFNAPDPRRPWSVHRAVVRCSRYRAVPVTVLLVNGYYDLTLDAAKEILDERSTSVWS